MGIGNALSDLYHGTIIGRRVDAARQQGVRDQRENNAFSALTQQYGPEAGAPDAMIGLSANARAVQQEQDRQAADLRQRQIAAQRGGIGIARSIVGLPADQQDAAIQHFAPILAQSFGTSPDQIVSTINTARQSPDPSAAFDALDAALAPQSEREINLNTQSREDIDAANNQRALEVARASDENKVTVAGMRGTGGAHAMTPQAQALVNTTRSRTIANALTQIRIARQAIQEGGTFHDNGPLATGLRGVLQFAPGTAESRFHTAVQAIGGINIANELQALAAAGVHPGRQASQLTEREGQALATLQHTQDPRELNRSLDALEQMYTQLSADLGAQSSASAAPAAATPAPAAAPAAGADPLGSYLGRQ